MCVRNSTYFRRLMWSEKKFAILIIETKVKIVEKKCWVKIYMLPNTLYMYMYSINISFDVAASEVLKIIKKIYILNQQFGKVSLT